MRGLGLRCSCALCSLALPLPQPGQREKSFQPEQDHGKVFRGHRYRDGVDEEVGGVTVPPSPGRQVTCLSPGTR